MGDMKENRPSNRRKSIDNEENSPKKEGKSKDKSRSVSRRASTTIDRSDNVDDKSPASAASNSPINNNNSNKVTTNNSSRDVRNTNTNGGNSRTRTKREPVHPLFVTFLPYCEDDEYWTSFLTRCSIGDLPRGCTLNGNVLSIKKTTDILNYELSGVTETAYKQFKKLMADNFKIGNGENATIIPKIVPPKNWSQIRRQKIKSGMIEQYIARLERDMKLDEKRVHQLQYCITLCITQNLLTNENVILSDGLIEDIVPIIWDEENFTINLPEPDHSANYTLPKHPIFNDYRDPPIDFQQDFDTMGKSRNKKAEARRIRKVEIDTDGE